MSVEDPRAFRQESRGRWSRVAGGWASQADWLRAVTMPVATWMVDAVSPQPGQTVLELAAGPGDTGFLAAELVKPGGELICSDFSPDMLTVAQERARALGIDNVRFKQIDAEAEIDLPAASIDAVLCRMGFMLMADPASALRETRRVLRPGGRLALAVWTAAEENEWMSLPAITLMKRGLVERPEQGAPGPMAWAEPGTIESFLEPAGFGDIVVDTVEFGLDFDSFEDYWRYTGDMSGQMSTALAGLRSAQERDDLRDAVRDAVADHIGADGATHFDARIWVAVAEA